MGLKNKMKPNNLKTKIFLDSGDPAETRKIIDLLGSLDGQTTNPSLVSKNPKIAKILEKGEKIPEDDLLEEYKKIVQEVSSLIPGGSVSIEVYADETTTAEVMINQGKEMNGWIPNAHIKLPTTKEGIKAAIELRKINIRVNMTLVFSQEQCAAIHMALDPGIRGDVFVSPFIGRLDDLDTDGIDLIINTQKMYSEAFSNVMILAASLRNIEHLVYLLYKQVDIITSPFKILEEWSNTNFFVPSKENPNYLDENIFFQNRKIKEPHDLDIPYKELDLTLDWEEVDIAHHLTRKGLENFAADWNKIIKS